MSTLTVTSPASAHRAEMVTQAVIAAYLEELAGGRRRARARVRPAPRRTTRSARRPCAPGRLSQSQQRMR
jgi:hypothetical protein